MTRSATSVPPVRRAATSSLTATPALPGTHLDAAATTFPARRNPTQPADGALGPVGARVQLGGVWFDNVTMDQAVARIDELVRARRPALVVTPNVDHVIRTQHDRQYAELVERADLVLADGQPIVWGARVLGFPLPERVAGSDLFPRLCAHAAERGYRVFFLGGAPGAAEAARDVLTARHPRLQVVGVHCPPMGFERSPAERRQALQAVQAAAPQFVFVGLGSPKQERWIVENMHAYSPAVSIGVGISFSFVAGHVKRAPRWMQRAGLEWLHRVATEPGRLAWRYLVRGWRLLPIALRDMGRAWLMHRPLVASHRFST